MTAAHLFKPRATVRISDGVDWSKDTPGKSYLGAVGGGLIISTTPENATVRKYLDVGQNPPKGAMLFSIEIPPHGGDTFWANMVLACEKLPARLRQAIEGRVAVHDATYNSAGIMRKGYKDVTDPREAPGARHALIKRHPETGRECLFLGRRRNSWIVGLPLDESERLLDELWAHATQPEFTFRQVWQVGDLMMWDNRCTLHRRDAFDPNARRLMHRTQIKGDWLTSKSAAAA